MRYKKCCIAATLALMLAMTTACGDAGKKGIQSTNAVENALQGQIAKEEQKTAAPGAQAETEAKTEAKTVAKTEAKTEAATQATTEKRDVLAELKDAYVDTPDPSVDIDLTAMSSDMVYATVANMVLGTPDDYVGKTVKMEGAYTIAESSVTNGIYHYVIIKDAMACCSQGIEFVWGDGSHTYPDEYPEQGSEVVVIGEFETYMEDGDPYLYSRLKDATMEVISTPSTQQQAATEAQVQ